MSEIIDRNCRAFDPRINSQHYLSVSVSQHEARHPRLRFHAGLVLLVVTSVVSFRSMVTSAFANQQPASFKQGKLVSELRMFNLFDDWKNFFQDWSAGGANRHGENDEDDDDDIPAGQYRIASISVESIKPGGLRLFLMFYLL